MSRQIAGGEMMLAQSAPPGAATGGTIRPQHRLSATGTGAAHAQRTGASRRIATIVPATSATRTASRVSRTPAAEDDEDDRQEGARGGGRFPRQDRPDGHAGGRRWDVAAGDDDERGAGRRVAVGQDAGPRRGGGALDGDPELAAELGLGVVERSLRTRAACRRPGRPSARAPRGPAPGSRSRRRTWPPSRSRSAGARARTGSSTALPRTGSRRRDSPERTPAARRPPRR